MKPATQLPAPLRDSILAILPLEPSQVIERLRGKFEAHAIREALSQLLATKQIQMDDAQVLAAAPTQLPAVATARPHQETAKDRFVLESHVGPCVWMADCKNNGTHHCVLEGDHTEHRCNEYCGFTWQSAPSPARQQEAPAANFIQQLPGGFCLAHGRYDSGTQCPKWPACITDPQPFKEEATGGREREIAERLKRITPGTWLYNSYNLVATIDYQDDNDEVCWVPVSAGDTATKQGGYNAEFIANAPDDIRYLLAELTRVRAWKQVIVHEETRATVESLIAAAQPDPPEGKSPQGDKTS